MEKERLSKKQLTALVIGVLTMVILVSSATYAYFSVTSGNSSGTTTIIGDIGGGTLGTITLDGGGTNLYLGVSAYDMSESKKGTTYYSSTEEGSRETNVNSAGKATYTATLSGDESDSVMYACDYEFTITSSGTALQSEHLSDISVVFEGDINKTVALSASGTISGTWYGFKKSNAEREFKAYLQLANTESEQNSLAGTNLEVEIDNSEWNCYLAKAKPADYGEAYALYTESNETLSFIRSETPINVGDTHNGEEITYVYSGFEESEEVPWSEIYSNITNIIFEDEIKPISIKYWFSNEDVDKFIRNTVDLTNLNTSKLTSLHSAFHVNEINNLIGINTWDVSDVIDMAWMFAEAIIKNEIDLSSWNVSNVTDMSYMFAYTTINANMGISEWDVSNVTNVSNMFEEAIINIDLGLSNWDTSNVTNMSQMFAWAKISEDIDLSGWDVSRVNCYYAFNIQVYGTGTLTSPTWKIAYIGVYSEDDYSLRIYSDINIPTEGSEYKGRTATKVYNISNRGSSSMCSSTVVPTQIIVEDNISPTRTRLWFSGCTKVNKIDVSKLDTSNVTDMHQMFNDTGNDTSVTSMTITGIEEFDTSKVSNMVYMFGNFGKYATYTLDLSDWDVSNIKSVNSYQNFNVGVETKVIAPSWPV